MPGLPNPGTTNNNWSIPAGQPGSVTQYQAGYTEEGAAARGLPPTTVPVELRTYDSGGTLGGLKESLGGVIKAAALPWGTALAGLWAAGAFGAAGATSAAAAPTAGGMGAAAAGAGGTVTTSGGFLATLGKSLLQTGVSSFVNAQLQRRAAAQAEREAQQLLQSFNNQVPPGGTMFEGFDIGGLLGNSMDALLKYQLQRKLVSAAPAPIPMMAATASAQPVAWPSLPSLPSIGSAIGGALGLGGTAVRAAAGLVRSAAGRIAGVVMASGRRVTVKQAVALAGNVGIGVAASTLGVSEQEVAEMILQHHQRKRGRARGITASSMRTTRRTIRQVSSLSRQIAQACSSSSFTRRAARRAAPPFAARASARCK